MGLLIFMLAATGVGIIIKPPYRPKLNTQPIGQVIALQGNIQSRLARSSQWFSLKVGAPLYEGQWLETTSTGNITLKIEPNDYFTLPPNTQLVLSKSSTARKKFLQYKISEEEVQFVINRATSNPTTTQQDEQEKRLNKLEKKLIVENKIAETLEQLPPGITDLQILTPQENEQWFFDPSQHIPITWTGPQDGEYEVTLHDSTSSLSQSFHVKQKTLLAWEPNPVWVNRQIELTIKDYKNQLKSAKRSFYIKSYPTLKITTPRESQDKIILTQRSPFRVTIESSEKPTLLSGELLLENQIIKLNWRDNEAIIPWSVIESQMGRGKEPVTIRVQAVWEKNNSIPTKIKKEVEWRGNVVLEPTDWYRLSNQPLIYACNKQNLNWQCVEGPVVEISPTVHYKSIQLVTEEGYQWELSAQASQQTFQICPPNLITQTKAKLILRSDNQSIKYESAWFTLERKIKTPPHIKEALAYKNSKGYSTYVATEHCGHIPITYQLMRNDELIVEKLSPQGNELFISDLPPTHVLVRYDSKTHGLATSEFANMPVHIDELKCESPKTESNNPTLKWTLKDEGKVYLQSKNTRPWTLLQWKSSQAFKEYELQIAKDPDFSHIIQSQITSQKSLQLVLDKSWQKIYWRVRGLVEDDEPSAWSEPRIVEILKLNPTNLKSRRISEPQE